MSTSSKPATKITGAAAKASRQAKLSIVQTSELEAVTTEQPTPVAVTELTETPAETSTASVAELQAARRTLDEQIKAAKAAQPAKQPKPEKPTKDLASVIAGQLERPRTDVPRIVACYVLAREAAGQDRATALDEVLGQMRGIVAGALDSRQPGETYHAAIYRYLGRADLLAQPASDDTSGTSDEQ